MHFKDWFRAPRHLLVLFFGITTISAATLGWLSLQIVRQDRALAVQRAREQRENAADAAVAVLQWSLSGLERDLDSIAAAGDDIESKAQAYSQNLSKDAVILLLGPDTLQGYPAGRLLYYPVTTTAQSSINGFTVADELEFKQRDYTRAIEVLRALAQSKDPPVNAEALIRLARNLHNTGRTRDGLAIYEQVSDLRNIQLYDTPADLIARSKVCDLLAELRDTDRLQGEALALYNDLQRGRWRLTRAVYDVYVDQARQILGSNVPANDDLRSARLITDAAYELWNRAAERLSEGRITLWISDQPVLAITRRIGDRLAALLVGPDQFTALLHAVQQAAGERSSAIALTDAQEHLVAGRLTDPPGSYAVRLTSATGLPWTVYATSKSGAADVAYARRGRLVMAGLFAIALLVLGGSYLIGRAVARELAVAKLQSDFVTAVSHEFRTPLTALRQLSELLAKGRVLNDGVRQQYYEVLEHETARLQRLVEGLLKFGRMEAGAVQYQFEAVDVAALLRSLIKEFTPEADRRGCHIEFHAAPAVPATQADREALGCVIWNLLDNAVKYSPGRDTVWLDLSRENGSVAIRVRDKGVGIPQQDHQRVFQKFVRGNDAVNLGVQGAGIGLAIAHQIVATHGGQIKLESEPGAGSTFTVLLPALES